MAVPKEERVVEILVNGQKANASLKEMTAAAAVLTAQFVKMSADDPGRAKLLADLQEAKARVNAVRMEIAGVTETTGVMQQAFGDAFRVLTGGGVVQAVMKVFQFFSSAREEFQQSQQAAGQLEASLTSTAHAAGLTADEIKKIGTERAKVTLFKEQDTENAAAMLLTFTNIKKGVFEEALPAIQNLATKMGGDGPADLKGASIQIGKALNDPVEGLKALTRVGVTFSEQQKDQIKAMVQAGNTAGAQRIILAELSKEFGGSAEAARKAAGGMATLSLEWDAMKLKLGSLVSGALNALSNVLVALPTFIKENRGALLGLGTAVLTLNFASIAATASTLAHAAAEKARAIATRASALAMALLDAAMDANPIGLVIAAISVLVGLFVTLYERSATVRSIISALGAVFKEFALTYVQGLITALTGLGDVLMGVFTLDMDRIKKGFQESFEGIKGMYLDAGVKAAKAFGEGYRTEQAKQDGQANREYEERRAQFARKIDDYLAKRAMQRAAAEKVSRMEALKNEEADLKERLAKVKADSEEELRIKQQLVTNNAKQELENVKLTAAERRIIEAEAEDARVKLAQEFYAKRAKQRKEAHDKAAAEALKQRLAEIEAEKLHKEMLAQVRQAAIAARGDELVTEMSQIYTQGQLKIAALQAEAEKEVAQFKGTAEKKAAFKRDIEAKLAADIDQVNRDVREKQGQEADKDNEKKLQQAKDQLAKELDVIEEGMAREQAAFEVPFHASLKLQQQIDEQKYQARQAAFRKELALIESTLGKESAEYKKVYTAMMKDQADQSKKSIKNKEDEVKAKKALQNMEMSTAGDVLAFGLDLLNQDADARKKHHTLYTALAAAKILIDGTKEVQQIWEYSAENPANGPTAGAAGIILGGIQTAVAVARTAVALGQLRGGSGATGSYYVGGVTGDGSGMAVSPMGQLLAASGMSVGSNGSLQDGSGFAVAGVVHEDEYVVPKWMRADPQVAAVEQWLEARRMRGFADGGPTTKLSAGSALPVPAASPVTGDEKIYAVLAQVLDANQAMVGHLADVKGWQQNLQVHLNLRDTQSGLDEYKQVRQNSAIRSSK